MTLLDAALDYLDDLIPLPKVARAYGLTEQELIAEFLEWDVPFRPGDLPFDAETGRKGRQDYLEFVAEPRAKETADEHAARMARGWVQWQLRRDPFMGYGISPIKQPIAQTGRPMEVAFSDGRRYTSGLLQRRRVRSSLERASSAMLNEMRAAGLLPERGIGVNRAGRYWH